MKTAALITFGCSKNLVDSEVMLGYLAGAGYRFVSSPEDADLIILNTCGFIQPAKEEAENALVEAVDLKTRFPEKRIIATGCYVERYKGALKARYPEVDDWLGVADFDKIVQASEGMPFFRAPSPFLLNHASPRAVSTPPGWAYLKISEGCSHQCSFCAIPLIKGSYRSRSITSIAQEANNLALRGVKEIDLISQDTTYFGRDLGLKDGLALLLRELVGIGRLEWIRILYGYPEEISDALLEVMQDPKICRYLDIPFQHSDPMIIQKMGRAMDGERALRLLNNIRRRMPDVAVRTSLIVGFPGEGRREFNSLKRFVREARFDHLGVFTYSREDQTGAFRWGDPISEKEKGERKEEIMEIQAEISYEKNRQYLGRTIEVLVEGREDSFPRRLVGRGRFQAPEVDGVVLIDSRRALTRVANSVQRVEIVARDVYDLHGKFSP